MDIDIARQMEAMGAQGAAVEHQDREYRDLFQQTQQLVTQSRASAVVTAATDKAQAILGQAKYTADSIGMCTSAWPKSKMTARGRRNVLWTLEMCSRYS